VIGYDIRQLEARDLILNREYQLEAIQPVRPEIIAKARLVRDAPSFDAKMSGYNFADFLIDILWHDRASFYPAKTNQRDATIVILISLRTTYELYVRRIQQNAGRNPCNAGLADPRMKGRFADLGGGTVVSGSPADFGKLVADETEKWGKVIRAENIKPE
jgi:hypothetical protein